MFLIVKLYYDINIIHNVNRCNWTCMARVGATVDVCEFSCFGLMRLYCPVCPAKNGQLLIGQLSSELNVSIILYVVLYMGWRQLNEDVV